MKHGKWIGIFLFCQSIHLYANSEPTVLVPPWKFGGYWKTFTIGVVPKEIPGITSENNAQWLNTFRLNFSYQAHSKLKFDLGYEFQQVVQSQNLTSSASTSSSGGLTSALPLSRGVRYRVVDLDTQWISNPQYFQLYHNLDRMAVYWNLPWGDLTFGRQAIAFGSAKVIQPTDVLLPFSFQQISTEYRIGVDAVRVQIPLAQMSELDLGLVVGSQGRASESAAFTRVKISLLETDWVLMGMNFSGANLIGGGIQRGIWDLGFSLDWAQVWPAQDSPYLRLSAGLDYAFSSGLMLFCEYHYNGAGAENPSGYFTQFNHFAYQKGGVFLLGRNYLFPGASYAITPLLNARSSILWNLSDQSWFISPSIEYSASESIFIDLGGFVALGQSPQVSGTSLVARSEYGFYPTQFFGDVRVYF